MNSPVMKRIALALVLGLGATIAQADEFDIVDYDIFRSTDPLAQRERIGSGPSGEGCERHGFCAKVSLAVVLLL